MAEETDGIEEAFEGQLRVLVTAAAQVGERIVRAREEAQRRAQATSEQEARELGSRLAAEQRAARAELGNVYRSDWWDRATPEQIGHTYQVARAWSQEDPEAVRAESRMRDELRTRYGVDVNQTHADPAAVRAAVERAEHDRAQADADRVRAAADSAEAARLVQQADREDARAEQARAAAEHEPDPDQRARATADADQRETSAGGAREEGRSPYDSAERRSATASELEAKGIDRELVASRMHADVAQAKPAGEAVKGAPAVAGAKARKGRGRGPQVQRTGLDR
ncbi:hypothetical protein AB6N23_01985 [Cellulomonas sp. 179-A 9B4 NHS]|uniref:hypothetical protein n=1 Tax=Cellulomonas sp. 179-A 9B4 NHS TaxID=3142379 RepID=UPI0039A334D5